MPERGAYSKGIRKRRMILEQALEVIARNGFSQTSVADIAEAVGISQAAVLYYFGTKEELLTQVLQARDERVVQAVLDVPGASVDEDAASIDTLASLPDVTRANQQVPGLVQLYVRLLAESTDPAHAAHAYFQDRYERFRTQATRDAAAHQSSGDLRDDIDPEDLAFLAIAVADGLQSLWLLRPDLDMGRLLEIFLRMFEPPAGRPGGS